MADSNTATKVSHQWMKINSEKSLVWAASKVAVTSSKIVRKPAKQAKKAARTLVATSSKLNYKQRYACNLDQDHQMSWRSF